MVATAVETPVSEPKQSMRDRIAEAARHASQISHEARQLKSMAVDAVGESVDAAKHAFGVVQRRVGDVAELKDEAVDRLKRQPWKWLSAAFVVGLTAGVTVSCLARRARAHE